MKRCPVRALPDRSSARGVDRQLVLSGVAADVAKSNLPFRSVMRVDSMSSPPWESDIPQIDASVSDVKKGDLLPLESRYRALEHISSYGGPHVYVH